MIVVSALAAQIDHPLAPPPEDWAAIWNAGLAVVPPARVTDPIPKAAITLFLEFNAPQSSGKRPVRLWQGEGEVAYAVALYAQADGSLRLVHDEIDIATPPEFFRPGDTIGLRYVCCARGRSDVIDFTNHISGQRMRFHTGLPLSARLQEVLPRDPAFLRVCHVAAIASFAVAPSDLPGFAAGTILSTPSGPMPVEKLRAGMAFQTVDGECCPVRWIERRPRLCLGRASPVRLRAPYFGLSQDICVTPETRVMRSGATVEYLFGQERVLMRASDMIPSPGARHDRRQAVRDIYHLMLDDHACAAIDACGIETALLSDVLSAEDGAPRFNLSQADYTPCFPVLDRAAAQALIAASARGRRPRG